MAVWRDTLLMHAGRGYDGARLVRLGEQAELIGEPVSFQTFEGRPVPCQQARSRGDAMWFLMGDEVHRFSLRGHLLDR